MSDTTTDVTTQSADTAGSATDSASTTGTDASTTTTTAADFKPPASQEELNRIIAERVRRTEAKYAGYADAVKKAEQFDAISEAQKTELQRFQERAEAAEQRAQQLESAQQIAAWKSEIAATAGVPVGVLRGNTEEELLAHAEELKAMLPDPRRGRK